jgi:hypothetical protein
MKSMAGILERKTDEFGNVMFSSGIAIHVITPLSAPLRLRMSIGLTAVKPPIKPLKGQLLERIGAIHSFQ